MEMLLQWLTQHADHAHYIIFILLLFSGFSLPISEELMLVAGGVLASSVIPENSVHLFIAVFLGCYLSDCIAYWLGRYFGKKLYNVRWLPFSLTESRVEKLASFYHKYGFLTLFIGRFIPFGVRNGIFMTAGVGKMHFGKFAVSDAIGCLVFCFMLFSLAYSFGKNYDAFCDLLNQGNWVLFLSFVVILAGFGTWRFIRGRKVSEKTLAQGSANGQE